MLRLSAMFSDYAVLQQGMELPVWGWTDPRTVVEGEFDGETRQVLSTVDGRFRLFFRSHPAGGPYVLRIRNLATGERIEARELMVGEVWLASGQSNMEFRIREVDPKLRVAEAGVRMIHVPHSARIGGRTDFEAAWQPATPEFTAEFSAVGFFFAQELARELGVTVGIVHSSWGGTVAEAWTSRGVLLQNPAYRPRVLSYEATQGNPELWEGEIDVDNFDRAPLVAKRLAELKVPANTGVEKGWAEPGFDDSGWAQMELPGSWVARGVRYNGVLWFRLQVELPESWAGRDLLLSLGAVDKQDVSYFNGVEVGATGEGLEESHWSELRRYTVPGQWVRAGRNVIAVRAFSFVYNGGLIGPAREMYCAPVGGDETPLPLSGNWKYETEVNIGFTFDFTQGSVESVPANPNLPYNLYENMIVPLLPYALRGAIWYQGESNESAPHEYRRLMSDLIADWRRQWGVGEFPFYQVQLANYRDPASYSEAERWPWIRDAQNRAAVDAGCELATAIDVGEACDIHPKDKQTVGKRLALLALHRDYGRCALTPTGPVWERMAVEDGALRLYFRRAEGLAWRKVGSDDSLFYLAGSDRVFHPAEAVIEGGSVVLRSAKVKAPEAARYAWADNPQGKMLVNRAGLPAAAFRTDNW